MQVNYPCSIVVDWLSVFGKRKYPDYLPYEVGRFSLKMLPYGSKLFKHIFNVSFVDDDGVIRPFGSLSINPTYVKNETLFEPGDIPEHFKVKKSKKGGLDEDVFLLKLDNQFLYEWDWFNATLEFFSCYCLEYKTLSRVDLAVDFQYLKNRVSGPQLVSRLKNLTWWKCGNNKCVEVYKMPYTIKVREKSFYDKSFEEALRSKDEEYISKKHCLNPNEVFLSPDEIFRSRDPENESVKVARNVTESMTFGTHGSLCQVQIYNKSAELRSTEVENVCKKEYIKRLWVERKINLPRRDVWRIELRFSSKAEVVLANGSRRPISIWDLDEPNLRTTFMNAIDSWFKIVDTGQEVITQSFIERWATHKSRMKVVELFDDKSITKFRRRKYSPNPNKFLKAVLNALSQRRLEIEAGTIPATQQDADKLRLAIETLKKVYGMATDNTMDMNEAVKEFNNILWQMSIPEAFECNVIPNIQLEFDL